MKISIRIPDQLLSDVDQLDGRNRTQKIINCLRVVVDNFDNDAINIAYLAERINLLEKERRTLTPEEQELLQKYRKWRLEHDLFVL